MADYVNASGSVLEVGGKSYPPGHKMSLNAAQLKDPTVDWWKRMGFITEGSEVSVVLSQPTFIPTPQEAEQGRAVETAEVPVAQDGKGAAKT